MDEFAQSNTSSREVVLGNNDSRRRRREGWALREDYGILGRSMESRVEAGRGRLRRGPKGRDGYGGYI